MSLTLHVHAAHALQAYGAAGCCRGPLPTPVAPPCRSLGVLLTELTTGTPVTMRGQQRLPRAPDDCPQEVVDLIQRCLAQQPDARPSAGRCCWRCRLRRDSQAAGCRSPTAARFQLKPVFTSIQFS